MNTEMSKQMGKKVAAVGFLILGTGFIASGFAQAAALSERHSAAVPSTIETSWRASTTQMFKGKMAKTTARREQIMKSRAAAMEDFILNFKGQYGTGDIPPMEFIFEEGAKFTALSISGGLNGVITRYAVSNLGSKGKVRGTLLLPVSGHNGNANARRWAVTDFYQVRTDSNPTKAAATHHSWGRTGREVLLLRSKSLDLVTKQEVELQMLKDIPVVVLYEREGSAGIGGYVEGRVMEFVWDGT